MTVVVPTLPTGTLPPAWRACVGTGRTREVLHADYRDSLALVQREIGFGAVRAHGILHDDMGLVRRHGHDGEAATRYAFGYLDLVIDTWLEAGVDPFLELGFMPQDLASGTDTVFWWQGNITPPSDPRAWADLVRALLRHLIARYGIERVRTWPVEVWNEPNLPVFWSGSEADYHDLYEVTAHAVKEVDAEIAVGGPAISPGADDWLPRFADVVERRGIPCDFVSKHAYTTGPAQHVPFGTYQTLRGPEQLLAQLATPRTLLAGTALAGLPVHITEFSSSYRPDNPIHDTAYQAAYLAPVLAAGGDVVDSLSYWTLCDVFEEVGIPTAPLHGGFGLLGHRQLRKPAFHLYAFMARLGTEVLARGRTTSSRVTPTAGSPRCCGSRSTPRRSRRQGTGSAWTSRWPGQRPGRRSSRRGVGRGASRRRRARQRPHRLAGHGLAPRADLQSHRRPARGVRTGVRRPRRPRARGPRAPRRRARPARRRAGRGLSHRPAARPVARRRAAARARPGRAGGTVSAVTPGASRGATGAEEVGRGPLSRVAAVVYRHVTLTALIALTTLPGAALAFALHRDASNIPLYVLALVPLAPALSAGLYAQRSWERDDDQRPALPFWRGYRRNLGDVLRWWLPVLAVGTVLAVNLAGARAVPGGAALVPLTLVLLVVLVLVCAHLLVITSVLRFRTRDAVRIALGGLARHWRFAVAVLCLLLVAAALVATTWDAALVLASGVLLAMLRPFTRPVVDDVTERFTARA
ncbi:GH39 family glycosyl hydrolase [Litorihabitans aurantiacus]|uniref:Glycosyl hydrolases family 39 N-terminal catalytic domain-containing protein n=1 Tax=Litorihabitans aurantiacus TaxID=1930061 RepID=A0AA37XIP8_9MICO|nr:DUF624 domain-containing protein [Litorihabitans aurantiacus]GMA33260.1 hypothetical protein GCM10025875_32520 [Litorihabitans aurantiacus]